MSLSEIDRRKLICEFCEKNPSKKKSEIFHHFKDLGFKKTTIYRTIKLFENSKSVNRKPGSGRKCGLQDKKVVVKLKAETVARTAKSYSELGRKYKVDPKTIKKYLREMNIQRKSKKSAPKTTEKQKATIKSRLCLLYQKYFTKNSTYMCVMDDESYFTVEGNEWQPKYYFESPEQQAPEKEKYLQKTKFPGKVMVWLAISERGISEPLFFKSGLAVNSSIYVNKCIPALQKFINKYHKKDKIVFWPDLASSHYAKHTLSSLQQSGIEYVEKDMNPPNVPQLRPIETFWAILKRKVYSKGYQAKNLDCLKRKIQKELKTMDTKRIQRAMSNVPKVVRKANRQGVNIFL